MWSRRKAFLMVVVVDVALVVLVASVDVVLKVLVIGAQSQGQNPSSLTGVRMVGVAAHGGQRLTERESDKGQGQTESSAGASPGHDALAGTCGENGTERQGHEPKRTAWPTEGWCWKPPACEW